MNWYLKVLKQYADFNGRARRKEYWMFLLFNITIIFSLLALIFGLQIRFLSIVYLIYALGTLIPSIAVGVRRMHDVGKSGWYLLIPIYSLILVCTDGEKGVNQYGSDPKNPANELNEIGVAES